MPACPASTASVVPAPEPVALLNRTVPPITVDVSVPRSRPTPRSSRTCSQDHECVTVAAVSVSVKVSPVGVNTPSAWKLLAFPKWLPLPVPVSSATRTADQARTLGHDADDPAEVMRDVLGCATADPGSILRMRPVAARHVEWDLRGPSSPAGEEAFDDEVSVVSGHTGPARQAEDPVRHVGGDRG